MVGVGNFIIVITVFFQVLEPENEEFAWEVRITILSYFAIFEFLPTLTVDTISIV